MIKNTIYKFGPLEPSESWQEIKLREHYEIRHFGEQGGNLYLWAEVNPDCAPEMRQFMVIGTGWEVPEGALYWGSVISPSGYVWHLYERA
jgi:hypothetical protein